VGGVGGGGGWGGVGGGGGLTAWGVGGHFAGGFRSMTASSTFILKVLPQGLW